jgi:hypothetical protein
MARLPSSDPQLTCIECMLRELDKKEKETKTETETDKKNRLKMRRNLFDEAAKRVVQLLDKTDPNPKSKKIK